MRRRIPAPGRAACGLGLLVVILCPFTRAEESRVVWDGRELHIKAPDLNFLTGRALETIRNGRAVAYDVQLRLTEGGLVRRRALERFVISYDLWEERFSVTRLSTGSTARRTSPNLTGRLAEAWCLQHISLPTEQLATDRAYGVELDIRAQEDRGATPAALQDGGGVSLSSLVEIFSRPARAQQQRWERRWPPVRLSQIERVSP